jgi:hypothetical protein
LTNSLGFGRGCFFWRRTFTNEGCARNKPWQTVSLISEGDIMSDRLSLGFSSADELSHSGNDEKNRWKKFGLILCVLIVLGLIFGYMMRSLDAQKDSLHRSREVGSEFTHLEWLPS